MKLKDQFKFVRQNMKKNKTRVFMTILATSIGCAFLIILASVGFGIHKSIVKDITENRIVTQIDVHGKKEGKGTGQLTDEDIQYFEKLQHVKAVTKRKNLHQDGTYSIEEYKGFAQTVVTHFPSELKAGFELSKGELPKAKNEIVVGYDFVKSLNPQNVDDEKMYDENGQKKEEYLYKDSLLGKKISLTVKQFVKGKEKTKDLELTIVGIGKKPTREWAEDRNVFISDEVLKEIEAFTGTPRGAMNDPNNGEVQELGFTDDSYDEIKIFAKNMEAVEGITEQLEKDQYFTYSAVHELKNVNKIFIIVKAGLIFVGTIAILIASIGIYNTMTMAVTERAPDIGIMKAIGANPKTIKRVFLLESSYIGIIGALVGTVVSYGISKLVNFALPLIISSAFDEQAPEGFMFSYIPISLPLICVAICYLVTILSGMRPAQRATKVDVLKALRREI